MQNTVREENVYVLATSQVLYDVHVHHVRFILFDLIFDSILCVSRELVLTYSVSSFYVDRGCVNKLDRLCLKKFEKRSFIENSYDACIYVVTGIV